MPEGRPAIPREMDRRVRVEAGHRCAIPACRQHPIEIEHIYEWSDERIHEFENLIALCPNCHRRKKDGDIDRKSLLIYKRNLSVLNSRYGEIERRLFEFFANTPTALAIPVGIGFQIGIMHGVHDGLFEISAQRSVGPGAVAELSIGGIPAVVDVIVTPKGRDFIQKWYNAEPID